MMSIPIAAAAQRAEVTASRRLPQILAELTRRPSLALRALPYERHRRAANWMWLSLVRLSVVEPYTNASPVLMAMKRYPPGGMVAPLRNACALVCSKTFGPNVLNTES